MCAPKRLPAEPLPKAAPTSPPSSRSSPVCRSRDGTPSSGSPWWVDSLEVPDGHTYVIAFVADNPGIWMDHCHNLPHAQQGLVSHLMYLGATSSFRITWMIDRARLDDGVRLLHRTFIEERTQPVP